MKNRRPSAPCDERIARLQGLVHGASGNMPSKLFLQPSDGGHDATTQPSSSCATRVQIPSRDQPQFARFAPGHQGWHRRANAETTIAPLTGNRSTKPPPAARLGPSDSTSATPTCTGTRLPQTWTLCFSHRLRHYKMCHLWNLHQLYCQRALRGGADRRASGPSSSRAVEQRKRYPPTAAVLPTTSRRRRQHDSPTYEG